MDATLFWVGLSDKKKTMRFPSLLILLIVCGLTACKKDVALLKGDYKGTYHSTNSLGTTVTANVTIHLGRTDFSGTADLPYPAICHGNWKASGNTIQFNDECVWLDLWAPILMGPFEYSLDGKHLRLSNTRPGLSAVYELDKVD